MIKIEHLNKSYGSENPLKDINIEINKGEIITIIGPSGTGKSTLLRCINLLETPTQGKIFVDGEEVTKKDYKAHLLRRKMGMVFQSFNLYNNKSVIENVMDAPINVFKKSKKEAYKDGMELLNLVGLTERADAYPDELSGGQKQRAAIARTLAINPEIILFDEPTSALDPTMVDEVLKVIRKLKNQGFTMIIVTHEMNFAKEISNRVVFLSEGIVYEEGSPEEIFVSPKKELTKQFISKNYK